jgi:Flp pilus assembly protein TadG
MRAGSFLNQESGTGQFEHSIAVLCFLAVIFGMMELCSAGYTYTVLADAANEGARYAMFNSADQTGAINTTKQYAAASLHKVSSINVSVTYPDGTTTAPARVAVNVNYSYVPYLGAFMTNPPAMHAFAEARIVR